MEESNKTTNETFNHSRGEIADKIALVGELEHARRHALRSAAMKVDDEDVCNDFLIIAEIAKEIRRELMQKSFPNIDQTYWCLCKSAACLRQLAYETCTKDAEILRRVDDLVDDIWERALDVDLSDCPACAEDKGTELGSIQDNTFESL